MNKSDFISTNLEYIGSLTGAGESHTEDEWKNIIRAEAEDYNQSFEDYEIGWIIEELEEAGLVTESR